MVNPSWQSFKRVKDDVNQDQSQDIDMVNQQQEPQVDLTRPIEEFEEELPGAVEDIKKPEGEKPQWGDFLSTTTYQGEVDPVEEEGTFGYLIRNISANASRLGEQILGAKGNVEKMGKDILNNYPQAGGLLGYALSELMGPERWERLVKGPEGRQQLAPTSEQIKDFSQRATKGYTKPKTPGEEKFQGYTEDIGSTLSGSRAPSVINNLGIPLSANLVKNTVKDLGFGEDKATIAKLGTWTALSLLGNVNAPKYASELMNKGRNGIPQEVNINVPRFQKSLQKVANDPSLLHADPRTALARQEIANIQKDLANGQVSTKSLMTTYDGVNAAKRDAGLFSLTASDRKFAAKAIDKVRNAVKEEILESGSSYKEALDNWKSGTQAWAVIHQSNAMTNWISSLSKGPHAKFLSGPAAALFGITSYGGVKSPLVAGPLAATIPAAYKGYQTAYRVWNDKNLSKYYWEAISNAQKENIPAFINNYNKLNKALEKSEPVKKNSKTNNR